MDTAAVITFSRRKKGGDAQGREDRGAACKAEEDVQQGETSLKPIPPPETPKDTIPARWRRKGAGNAKQKQEADHQAYLAEMKAHFAEVDAFDLVVETPTPPGKAAPSVQPDSSWAAGKHRHAMALGLSRRSTLGASRLSTLPTAAALSPSPLRINVGATSAGVQRALPDVPGFRLHVPSGNQDFATGRMESVQRGMVSAPAEHRRSSVSGVFSRLSLRLSDALHKLSRRSSTALAGDQAAAAVEEALKEDKVTGLGHAAECPTTAQPADAGMFTIAEETNGTPPPSSPAADLSKELQKRLTLDDGATPASPSFADLPPLQQLLRLCGQEGDVGCLPSMEELLGRHVDLTAVKKIGEGTFGEAFKAGGVVLKIVPMEGSIPVNGEPQKRSEEILAEVAITLTLSGLRRSPQIEDRLENRGPAGQNSTSGFVETHGVGICRGAYAPALLREWHLWDAQNGSENDPVDIFHGDQLFVVFVVADGGLDLEHFEPHSFAELRSILMQATMTLAVAEEACDFEHRDLHWGNLLISRDGTETVSSRFRGVDVVVKAAGVRVTLIDFTLSRLLTPEGEVAFCDLAADPELFNGPKGDIQAETYRRMRKATRDDWQRFMPATNVFWLRYLADIILAQKLPAGCTNEDRRALRNFKKATASCGAAADMVWNELFDSIWRAGPAPE